MIESLSILVNNSFGILVSFDNSSIAASLNSISEPVVFVDVSGLDESFKAVNPVICCSISKKCKNIAFARSPSSVVSLPLFFEKFSISDNISRSVNACSFLSDRYSSANSTPVSYITLDLALLANSFLSKYFAIILLAASDETADG